MKYFTHPEGIFEIKIPLDWYYKNEVAGIENKSPFSFELFEDTKGCFQISCYHKSEKELNPILPKASYNCQDLVFIPKELPDPEFKVLLWATNVEEYFFMAKYICQPNEVNLKAIEEEIKKVENSLSTLMCLSPDRRELAIGFDRYEKFNAALAGSFDLKIKAMDNLSFTEIIIINANQIDAYLRLCIAFKFQIIDKTHLFRLEYLYQGAKDKPIMEKKIYDQAKDMSILTEEHHKKLYSLYDQRNRVVHRYIITDIKTRELVEISYEYELLCEVMRVILSKIETEQFENKLGYHSSKDPHREKGKNLIDELFSKVNDKHFLKEFHRSI